MFSRFAAAAFAAGLSALLFASSAGAAPPVQPPAGGAAASAARAPATAAQAAAAQAAEPGAQGAVLAPGELLVGSDEGLYAMPHPGGPARPLWTEGEVRKILRNPAGWFLLSSKGILFSKDLAGFEERSKGLPLKTYKRYAGGTKSFSTEVQDLKDLEADLLDPLRLLACTKNSVFISRDGGLRWESLGSPSPIPGLKAVAFGGFPGTGEPGIWASHPIKGLFAAKLPEPGFGALKASAWIQANAGLAAISGTTSPEEIADMASLAGAGSPFWASNSFVPHIYRWDPVAKYFATAWSESSDFGCAESLAPLPDGSLRFVTEGGVRRLRPGGLVETDAQAAALVRAAAASLPEQQILSLAWAEGGGIQTLSELWLVLFRDRKSYRAVAENRHGLYLSTGFVVSPEAREKYSAFMEDRRLDSVVVDIKDDFGRLRFEPRDFLVKKHGRVFSPLDVETFVSEWKSKGRYLIARIPVFKDQALFEYSKGVYAVWDEEAKAPWRGYNLVRKAEPAPPLAAPPAAAKAPTVGAAPGGLVPGGTGPGLAQLAQPPPPAPPPAPVFERELIREHWVDPYCEQVWVYNVAIANEILERGFDEVQFDYIRFPTDGENLDKASYRWRESGMDKESALTSFLRYARENIDAPISVDIYGANGWYRSGVRTGQDVELLAKYADVICPMFYPSHFEQGFLAHSPAEERPYRIYRIGALRNAHIARKRVAVRPYVQAFFLDVSYDRAYYGLDYVKREVEGVRDSVNLGLTFWNNSGRYDDVPILELAPDGRLAAGGSREAQSGREESE